MTTVPTSLTPMTVEEFFDTVVGEVITGVPQKNDQRVGQWWFNRLHDVRPDVANEIRGSLTDPFHRDDILNAFHLRIIELW